MSVAKLRAGSTLDTMKSDEGNDSVDTFIRHAIGREPLLSFSRTGESQVQWIQFLHALDQQDIPGWPLLSPLKVQMQKCEKCSREFCSPINYRRHIRVHRRSLNVDKESHKNRDLLGAFWDKLSLEESKEIVSFTDVTLEEIAGSSVIKALTSLIRKPGFCALPQVYLRAGSALLDIIQARPSRLQINSQDLFGILDDASERTFLCAGTTESMQKYVFDGEAGKIALEMKNVVACTSFLIERKLVKAWLADKDAEALRCQKLLVEEEEAAQKRQAEILERKRQKKLRQKEQRAKEQPNGDKTDLKEVFTDTSESPSSAESSSLAVYESSSDAIESLEPILLPNAEETDVEAQLGFNSEHSDSSNYRNVEYQTFQASGRRHIVNARWQVPKSQRVGKNGFHASHNLQVSKLEPAQKHSSVRNARAGPTVNGQKVWTRKSKAENDRDTLKTRLSEEATHQTDHSKKCEIMIGSISVTLGNSNARQSEAQDIIQEKRTKTDSSQFGTNRSSVKLWRPKSRNETRGPVPVQSGSQEFEPDVVIGKSDDRTMGGESCARSSAMDENGVEGVNNPRQFSGENAQPEGLLFSSRAAKAFLAQRWKEAIAAEHVKLVLSPKSDPPGKNQLASVESLDSSTIGNTNKAKFRPNVEKNIKIKYIPKQRTIT